MSQPKVFGRYLLLDPIAEGGMAEVYRAKQFIEDGSDRIVAIKRILARVANDEAFISMFRDEATITRNLKHDNIARVFDFGRLDGHYYLAMEYVPGVDAKAVFRHAQTQGNYLSPALTAFIVREVAAGLGYAHRAKHEDGRPLDLIHRDVSPQNILLNWDGGVKLIDFGVAKARQKTVRTDAGVLKGKFAYMSPEQVRGLPITQRSDIFGLGVVFWELLTSHRAFDRESDYATMDAVRALDISEFGEVAPHVPEALRAICLKALALDEEERYASGEALARDLDRWLATEGVDGKKELSAHLKSIFPQDYGDEQLRRRKYQSYGVELVEGTIRAAGSSTSSHKRVQIEVGGQISVTPRASQPPSKAPSEPPRPAEPPRSAGLMVAVAAVLLIVVGGFMGWNWWQSRPGALLISSQPAQVEVSIDGEAIGRTAASPDGRGSLLIPELPNGARRVTLRAAGHEPLNATIVIKGGQTFSWQANLPKEALPDGRIRLRVHPPDARVQLNQERQTTNAGEATIVLGGGVKKELYISANNHQPHRATIGPLKPGSDEPLEVKLKLERWSLTVTPTPAQARVTLRASGGEATTGRGAQSLRGLAPDASVQVLVSSKGCRRKAMSVRSEGEGERDLKVELRCR